MRAPRSNAVAFCLWAVVFFGTAAALTGCVRNVTVCATYDRRLGAERADRYARDSAGASVCADVAPPGSDG